MKHLAIALIPLLVAAPASATGGMTCRTAGAQPLEVAIGLGHVPGAPIIGIGLIEAGRPVPVTAPQWWLDQSELRLVLTSPNSLDREAIVRTRRNGQVYDGSIWRGGKRRWIRCRES